MKISILSLLLAVVPAIAQTCQQECAASCEATGRACGRECGENTACQDTCLALFQTCRDEECPLSCCVESCEDDCSTDFSACCAGNPEGCEGICGPAFLACEAGCEASCLATPEPTYAPTPAPTETCEDSCKATCRDDGLACGRACGGDPACEGVCRDGAAVCNSACGPDCCWDECYSPCQDAGQACRRACDGDRTCERGCQSDFNDCSDACSGLCYPTEEPTMPPTATPTLAPTYDCYDSCQMGCEEDGRLCETGCDGNPACLAGCRDTYNTCAWWCGADCCYSDCDDVCTEDGRQCRRDCEGDRQCERGCQQTYNGCSGTCAGTCYPTEEPTPAPTAGPTMMPTYMPTVAPTYMPTTAPTYMPTTAPTYMPTAAPTYMPTYMPTAVPTYMPTPSPTFAPSPGATPVPTAPPTEEPTYMPSDPPASNLLPLFDFGSGVGDVLAPNGDDSPHTPLNGVSPPICFYGINYTTVVANINGVFSFGGSFSDYTPWIMPTTGGGTPIVAPYWGDLRTDCFTPAGAAEVWSRASTATADIDLADDMIDRHPDGGSYIGSEGVIVATWYQVDNYDCTGEFNTFQSALAYNTAGQAWLLVSYGTLTFFNSSTAPFYAVGWDSRTGLGTTYLEVDSDPDMIGLQDGTNLVPAQRGVYAFEIIKETQAPTVAPTPAPTSPPTLMPTPVPTVSPTVGETEEPTPGPTPTFAPTDGTNLLPLFDFGSAVGDILNPGGDDSPNTPINGVSPAVPFYGSTYTTIVANINGVFSLGSQFSTFTPWVMPTNTGGTPPIICPYWGDLRTSCGLSAEEVWSRASTTAADRALADDMISRHPSGGSYTGSEGVVIATWYQVENFNCVGSFVTFQAGIGYNTGGQAWLFVSYGTLTFWSSTTAPFYAVGWDDRNGNGLNYLTVDSTPDMEGLAAGSNLVPEQRGTYAFQLNVQP